MSVLAKKSEHPLHCTAHETKGDKDLGASENVFGLGFKVWVGT